jgi:hypothetical protein
MIQQMNVGAFSESLTTSTEWQTTIDSRKNSLKFLQSHFGLGWMFSKDSSFSIKMPEQEQSNNKFNI